MYIEPSNKLQIDWYIDSDFVDLWGVDQDEDQDQDQNRIWIHSRTCYLIECMSDPLIYV